MTPPVFSVPVFSVPVFSVPVFSVIVPVFDAGRTIDATVRSVLAQSETRLELLLIDDGSSDDSLARMLALAATDERIRVIAQRNSGVAATRNLGAEQSRGEWLAFLDADDLWHPAKLAAHLAHHRADPDAVASYAQIAFIESDEHDLASARTRSTVGRAALTVTALLGENPVCTTSNLVVARACFADIGGFRAGMSHAEDQEWLARAAAGGHRITGIDRLLVGYRMSRDGLSADLGAMHAGWRLLAERYGENDDRARAEAIFCRYLARRALRTDAAPFASLGFAASGLRSDAAAFFSDPRRALGTLAGALARPLLPPALRIRLFA